MLIKRVIPASILIILIGGLFYLDYYFKTTIGFTVVVCLVGAGALYEFYKMYENIGIKLPKVFPIVIAVSLIVISYALPHMGAFPSRYADIKQTFLWMAGIFIFSLVSIVYYLFNINKFPDILILLLGFIYIWSPLMFGLQLYTSENGQIGLIFIIGAVKISDSMAYFGGKWWGKHKLAPTISPNKTVEGLLFGLIGGTFLVTVVLVIIMLCKTVGTGYIESIMIFVMFFIIMLFGHLGDLFESSIKRHCHVKDSGKLLGGLGGVLDMADSLLFGITVTFIVYTFNVWLKSPVK